MGAFFERGGREQACSHAPGYIKGIKRPGPRKETFLLGTAGSPQDAAVAEDSEYAVDDYQLVVLRGLGTRQVDVALGVAAHMFRGRVGQPGEFMILLWRNRAVNSRSAIQKEF